MVTSRRTVPWIRNVSDKFSRKSRHFMCNKFSRLWDNMENYGRTGQTTEDNVIQRRKDVICMPGNSGKNTDAHWEYIILIIVKSSEIFCRSTTVQKEPIAAVPWQHWTLLYCTQVHVRQQKQKGNYCCVSMATVVTLTRHNVTWHVQCVLCLVCNIITMAFWTVSATAT